MTRSVLAQQVRPDSRDVAAAGDTTNFVGVFQVREDPSAEFLDRAVAASESDRASVCPAPAGPEDPPAEPGELLNPA